MPDQPTAPVAAPPEMVPLVSPNGELYHVPYNNVQKALSGGWRMPNEQDLKLQSAKEELQAEGGEGALGTGLSSFVNQIAFGIPDYLAQKHAEQGTEEDKLRFQAQQQINQEHSTARLVGGGVGLAANVALTGGVLGRAGQAAEVATLGSEAEAGAIRTALAKGANYATQGALMSAPLATTQIAEGDVKLGAESLGVGSGLGLVLGVGGSLAGSAFEGAKGLFSGRIPNTPEAQLEALEASANDNLLNLGFDKPKISQMSLQEKTDLLQTLMKTGVYQEGMSKAQIVSAARKAAAQTDQVLSGMTERLDNTIAANPNLAPNTAAWAAQMRSELEQGLVLPAQNNVLRQIKTWEATIANQSSDASIANMQHLKDELMRGYNPADTSLLSVKQGQLGDFLQTKINESASNIAKASSDTQLLTDWATAQQQASVYKRIGDVIDNLSANPSESGMSLKEMLSVHHGGLAGYAIGHALSPILGPLAHPVAMAATKGLFRWLENPTRLTSNMIGQFRKLASNPATADMVGGLIAQDMLNGVQEHIGQVPDFLAGKTVPANDTNPIKDILGSEANGLSKKQQLFRVMDRLAILSAQPDLVQQRAGEVQAQVSPTNPAVAQAFGDHTQQKIAYLASVMPKNPKPPQPFTPNDWTPSAKEIKDFTDSLKVANDPQWIMKSVQDGTLTPQQVKAFATCYPEIYKGITTAIANAGSDPKLQALPTSVKQKISMLTGTPLDPALKYLQQNQGIVYAPPSQNGGKKSSSVKLGNISNYQTQSQKLSGQ